MIPLHLRAFLRYAITAVSFSLIGAAADLTGAGATFPQPVYAKWIHSFESKNPAIHIHYEPTGSEEGLSQLRGQTIDFAACDFPAEEKDNGRYLRFPTVVGAVVPAYNIPGFLGDLRLSPQTLAGIYLGKIKRWNDPAISHINPGVQLPANNIVVIHRSEGSGTTFIWSDYLSKVSPEWQAAVGRGSVLHWPVGETVTGNEGMASMVTRTSNSIGYLEFIYGVQHKLSIAAVQNATGNFVQPDLSSISEAAASGVVSEDFRASITNAPGANAYPICSFTWFVIPTHIKDETKRQDLFRFLDWLLTFGQRQTAALGYVSTPKDLLAREQAAVTRAQAAR